MSSGEVMPKPESALGAWKGAGASEWEGEGEGKGGGEGARWVGDGGDDSLGALGDNGFSRAA